MAVFGHIFFTLITNLPAKVNRILSKFESRKLLFKNDVNAHSIGSLTNRSAEAMELKNVKRVKSLPGLLRPLKTRDSLRRKFTRTATWLLITAYKRYADPPSTLASRLARVLIWLRIYMR